MPRDTFTHVYEAEEATQTEARETCRQHPTGYLRYEM